MKEGQSINTIARVAGLLYLLLIPLSTFGMLYVRAALLVPGDAAATAANILGAETGFRFSIVSALLTQVVNLVVVLVLYQLLQAVNRPMARLMVMCFLAGVPIAMLNELNNCAVLLLLHGGDSLAVFSPDQLRALVPVLLAVHEYGISIATIFWGIWLFPMGYLVFQSGFLPRVLGILLVIGCVGYLIQSFATLLVPNFSANLAMFTFWGELFFPLWLLIKGVNVEQWNRRALAAA